MSIQICNLPAIYLVGLGKICVHWLVNTGDIDGRADRDNIKIRPGLASPGGNSRSRFTVEIPLEFYGIISYRMSNGKRETPFHTTPTFDRQSRALSRPNFTSMKIFRIIPGHPFASQLHTRGSRHGLRCSKMIPGTGQRPSGRPVPAPSL